MHHLAAERRIRIVQAWRIDEHNLPALLGDNALNAIAGGLRFGGNDCDFLPDQLIDEGGLSRIGPAHDGHEAGAVVFGGCGFLVWWRHG